MYNWITSNCEGHIPLLKTRCAFTVRYQVLGLALVSNTNSEWQRASWRYHFYIQNMIFGYSHWCILWCINHNCVVCCAIIMTLDTYNTSMCTNYYIHITVDSIISSFEWISYHSTLVTTQTLVPILWILVIVVQLQYIPLLKTRCAFTVRYQVLGLALVSNTNSEWQRASWRYHFYIQNIII